MRKTLVFSVVLFFGYCVERPNPHVRLELERLRNFVDSSFMLNESWKASSDNGVGIFYPVEQGGWGIYENYKNLYAERLAAVMKHEQYLNTEMKMSLDSLQHKFESLIPPIK